MDMIFHELANIWIHMKTQARMNEDYASLQYKFRTRMLKIESIIELDISTLGKSLTNESFLEWKELHSDDEYAGKVIN